MVDASGPTANDEEDDQPSSWLGELEGENAEELASQETPDEEGEWCWPKKSRVKGELTHDGHSTVQPKMMKDEQTSRD